MSDTITILSLESAGKICSACLSKNGEISATYTIYLANKHDKFLAEFAKRLLNDLEINFSELDAIAISAGPGSFTGLRICGSIAKAMCLEDIPKLIAVPSLKAFAYNTIKNFFKDKSKLFQDNIRSNSINKIVSTIQAQKDLIYYQEFTSDFIELSEAQLINQEEFLKKDLNTAIICGTAAHLFPELFVDYNSLIFSSELISNLANKMYKENEFTQANDYSPLYIQDFQVKVLKR